MQCALLKIAYVAAQRFEGITTTPDKAFMILASLNKLLVESRKKDLVLKVYVPAAAGTAQIKYVDRKFGALQKPVRVAARVLEKLHSLLMLALSYPICARSSSIRNFLKDASFLSSTQNELAGAHLEARLIYVMLSCL